MNFPRLHKQLSGTNDDLLGLGDFDDDFEDEKHGIGRGSFQVSDDSGEESGGGHVGRKKQRSRRKRSDSSQSAGGGQSKKRANEKERSRSRSQESAGYDPLEPLSRHNSSRQTP